MNKNDVLKQIKQGSVILLEVGNLFHKEVVETTVRSISKNGQFASFADSPNYFKISDLKIIDILS